MIRLCHLQFIFKISDSAEPADQHSGSDRTGKINGKAFERNNLHIAQMPGHTTNHFNTFLSGKQRFFRFVVENADDQAIEHTGRAFDDIQVSKRDRVKASGIDSDFFSYVIHGIPPVSYALTF